MYKGGKFMGKHLKKKQDEFIEKMKECDSALLELLKQGHRELILKVIKDYLSQP